MPLRRTTCGQNQPDVCRCCAGRCRKSRKQPAVCRLTPANSHPQAAETIRPPAAISSPEQRCCGGHIRVGRLRFVRAVSPKGFSTRTARRSGNATVIQGACLAALPEPPLPGEYDCANSATVRATCGICQRSERCLQRGIGYIHDALPLKAGVCLQSLRMGGVRIIPRHNGIVRVPGAHLPKADDGCSQGLCCY